MEAGRSRPRPPRRRQTLPPPPQRPRTPNHHSKKNRLGPLHYVVILSGVTVSRSEAVTQSKDPYQPARPPARQGIFCNRRGPGRTLSHPQPRGSPHPLHIPILIHAHHQPPPHADNRHHRLQLLQPHIHHPHFSLSP